MNKLTPTTAAYLAGIIDGEGYVGITANRTGSAAKSCKRGISFRAMIAVRMTDEPIVRSLCADAGIGKVNFCRSRQMKHSDAWQWNVWSREAPLLGRAILPFLRLKGSQVETLIRFQDAMRFPGSKGLTDAEWELRQNLHAHCAGLNKRGSDSHAHQ